LVGECNLIGRKLEETLPAGGKQAAKNATIIAKLFSLYMLMLSTSFSANTKRSSLTPNEPEIIFKSKFINFMIL
jgi:hypothetical protein